MRLSEATTIARDIVNQADPKDPRTQWEYRPGSGTVWFVRAQDDTILGKVEATYNNVENILLLKYHARSNVYENVAQVPAVQFEPIQNDANCDAVADFDEAIADAHNLERE